MKSARRVALAIVLVGSIGSLNRVQADLIYDAAADFSPTSNPNSVWSYGSSATLGSAFILGTAHGNSLGIDYWVNDWLTAAPSITHNGTGSPITFAGVSWQPGQLGFHPGSAGQNAVIRFTAPSSATYSLDAAFAGLDQTPTTTDVHILLNGTSIFDGIVNAFGSGPAFSAALALSGGDTVDFSVGFGQNGNYYQRYDGNLRNPDGCS